MKVAVYRCGPVEPFSSACGHEFRVKGDGYPYECPGCRSVFCGDDCCGNIAEFVRQEEVDDQQGDSKEHIGKQG